MKLLYASERPPFPFFLGGAARSAHYLMSALASECGVECLAVGSRDFTGSLWSTPDDEEKETLGIRDVIEASDSTTLQCGYTVKVLSDFGKSFPNFVLEFRPDVIWTQLDGIEVIAKFARQQRIPTIVYLRDAEDAPATIRSLSKQGVRFVCNSKFMAERVRRITGKSADVIYPSFDIRPSVVGKSDGYITMINPHRVKGVDTFLEIARLLPDEKFLLVESWTLGDAAFKRLIDQIDQLPNVQFSHRVSDVQTIYQQTKILLVPSVWEEAFGRVVIEAQSCRIPVIASERGGLPEAVGKGGLCILDYLNPNAWVTAIRGLLNDTQTYRALAQDAYDHANNELFSTNYAARTFLDICIRHSTNEHSARGVIRSLLARLRGISGMEDDDVNRPSKHTSSGRRA